MESFDFQLFFSCHHAFSLQYSSPLKGERNTDHGKTIRADRGAILRLAERKVLDARQTQDALVRAGIIPGPAAWRRFITVSSLSLGAALFLSGMVFFFAFNWHLLHKFIKLGSIAALLALSITAGFMKGHGTPAGKVAWIAASVITGVYLAVFGQIYQTGADAWQLFASWALLIAGWTAVSLYAPHWALFLVITETTAVLYLIQSGNARGEFIQPFVLLAAVNAALYLAFDLLRRSGAAWLDRPWFVRLLATAAIAFFLIPVSIYILDFKTTAGNDFFPGLTLLLFAAFGAALFPVLKKSHDLYILAVAIFSLIVYGSALYIHVIGRPEFDSFFAWLVLGFLIVAQAAGAVFILKAVAGYWSRRITANEND